MTQLLNLIKNKDLFKECAFIGGQWLRHDDIITVTNPANDELIGQVPNMGQNEAKQAIIEADQAFKLWKNLLAKERAVIMRQWHQLILANKQDLAIIITLEQGKTLNESELEVEYAASFVEWFAEEAKRTYGDVIPATKPGQQIIVQQEPVGVVGAITPWNYPLSMVTRKVAPAIAAGCTIVLKPSELTPYSALALAYLAEQAGIPAGVFNVVTGNAELIGKELTNNQIVKKISFTGSTKVGKLLMANCAGTVKRMSMELGGNAPVIIFDDADIDLAVQGALYAKYRNNGQTCICANRIYVHSRIYDQFIEKARLFISQLRVGSGLEAVIQLGPLVSKAAIAKVQRLLDDATAKGATLLVGGKQIAGSGCFFEPSLLVGVNADMSIAREEIFGPIAVIYQFDSDEEVVAEANDTEYGLAAYFYTTSVSKIFKISRDLQYGMVGINDTGISNEVAPFGGVKQSGFGREGSYLGIKEFLNVKYLCVGNL